MKITYDPEKFGDLKPGDDVQLMGVGVVSDDGKSIGIVSIEQQVLGDDGSDEDETGGDGVVSEDGKPIEIASNEDQDTGDDDSDDENEPEGETESPKQETETEEAEELAEGADIGSIIASGFGAEPTIKP